MGEPVIINDGSPVKVTWHGDNGWKLDEQELSIVREGNLELKWILFNVDLLGIVHVDGALQMKVNFRLEPEMMDLTLLVSTDQYRKNLRLAIEDPGKKKFSDFFAPPPDKDDCKRFQTPTSASITGISYQIGGGDPQKAPTEEELPTSIFLELEEPRN